jgi:hypothetical protein
LLPDSLKPYSCLIPLFVGFKGGLPKDEIRREILELSDRYNIPIQPIVRMAYDHWTKQWNPGMEVPIRELEEMFKKHKNIYGAKIVETGGEAGFFSNERKYLLAAIKLAVKYDKVITFWDHANMWQILLLDEEFIDLIKKHSDNFIPFWKMNGGNTEYADQGMPFGLWASRLVNRWGVNPQASWYWFEAGFRKIWNGRFPFGWESAAPDILWGMMSLLGANAGASAYLFEGCEGWFWNFQSKSEESSDTPWDPDTSSYSRKNKLPNKLDCTDTFKKSFTLPLSCLLLKKR